ncbi:proteasome assembly chaperone family protein [Hyperthermus butylicus]|uniref:Archaeal enzymes of ATP-grasp superfamily n=1 Tax=Hyperthermus butylicus (strain DSM 5456 / JCM 9403 / PLM1-5) TaxID=415426 RepID=A2BK23_HYPBU|nr:PAC2 family protein [Hyperthermus butylicus]ABM80334.1 Archaeal enzymes of ATP-grasp superfamily [Hyperthermus butylicus DSM 5456]
MAFRARFEYKGIRIAYDEALLEGASLFVSGFKGYGAVGYIATLHLAEKANCSKAGFVLTKYMPEAVTPGSSGIVAPFTLYSCMPRDDFRILLLVNHDIPVVYERARFAEAIVRFLVERNIPEAVLIGGFDARYKQGDEKFRWVATAAYSRSLDAPKMDKGLYVIGPLALLLLYAEVYGYPAVALLPYTETARPDPRAAAAAIEVINKLYGFSIGVDELLEEARKIEEMIVLMEQQQKEALIPPSSERAYM